MVIGIIEIFGVFCMVDVLRFFILRIGRTILHSILFAGMSYHGYKYILGKYQITFTYKFHFCPKVHNRSA